MKVVGVGTVCIDYYPKLNRYYATGNGVDFVIHLSRFGMETSIVSMVGTDSYGKLMIDTLGEKGVDTSHIRIREGKTAVVQMDLNGRDRVHGAFDAGVMDQFSLTQDDVEFILRHDMIHVDMDCRIFELLPMFHEKGKKIVFDFSVRLKDPSVQNLLRSVDYAFFSYNQKDPYILDFVKWAKSCGPQIVTVTLGPNGSLSYDGKNIYESGPMPAKVVNTVGAGDSFIAGFMSGIINGKGIEESMKKGTETATKVIQIFNPY
ncbi:MAG TPA: fructoselysine 6-kinase [Clostridia bacterium]|nr:fructoselysine 6-kinase [Clostridia bacterium]